MLCILAGYVGIEFVRIHVVLAQITNVNVVLDGGVFGESRKVLALQIGMTKILYVVSTLKRCGPTNLLYNLIKYMDKSVFKPVLITLSPEPKDSRWQEFEKLGVELYTLGLSRIKGLFCAVSKLKKIISELDVDIVHTLGIRADAIAAMRLGGRMTVATLCNCPCYDYTMRYGKIAGHLMAIHHLKMLRRIKHPVAVSNSVSTTLSEKNNLTIDVIHNGVDSDVFYPPVSNEFKQELRRNLGIPLTKKVFISVGHLTALKDPLTIVKAFQDKNIPSDCYLVVIGDGPLLSYCQKYGNSDNMVFFGRVPSVTEYLQACDFFVSSSKTEGLPGAPMEAIACGLPCVLSDIEPHREIIEYNHKSGKLFETKNVRIMVSKINEIIRDDYSEMSRAAISIISDSLNAKAMSEKYQGLYLRICTN